MKLPSWRFPLTFVLALSVTITVTPIASAEHLPPLSLGEVSSGVVRRDVDLRAILRDSLEEEIRALDLHRVPRAKRAILSVALVRMDTVPGADATNVTTCVVSATLRDAKRGAVFAILEGRALAKSDASTVAILKTAVHGAMARVPEAMRR